MGAFPAAIRLAIVCVFLVLTRRGVNAAALGFLLAHVFIIDGFFCELHSSAFWSQSQNQSLDRCRFLLPLLVSAAIRSPSWSCRERPRHAPRVEQKRQRTLK